MTDLSLSGRHTSGHASRTETRWKPALSKVAPNNTGTGASVKTDSDEQTNRRQVSASAGQHPQSDWQRFVEAAYELHFDKMCRSISRLVDSQHAAEEVVQEAFVRFTMLNTRPESGREVAYLRSIVFNEARSALRRQRTRQEYLHHLAPRHPNDDTWIGAQHLVDAGHMSDHLRSLPGRQRQVVALRHLVGLSERETARALDISVGSVKTHCSRGLAALRSRMRDAA